MAKSNKTAFTKASVAALKPPTKGRTWRHDSRCRGLSVMVTPNGAKSFYFYRWVHGRPAQVRLGSVDDLTIDQARKRVEGLSGEIAQGHDPIGDRQRVKSDGTLQSAFDSFIVGPTRHKEKRKRATTTTAEYRRAWKKYIPNAWKNRKLADLKRSQIVALHERIGAEAPYQANRVLAMICAVFNAAIDLGWQGTNPASRIRPFKESARERFIQPDEMRGLLAAIDSEGGVFRDYFVLLLLTGARRSAVCAMRWAAVNLSAATWTLGHDDTKSKKGQIIHLPGPAVEILKARHESRESPEWVFPSHGRTGHVTEPKGAWKRVTSAAGLEGVRVHDLRRTLGSWLASSGASLPVIGSALGHSSSQATAVYARLQRDSVVEAVDGVVVRMLAYTVPQLDAD